jgi:threonine/homoserine/homoserine lactone efflux protein
MSLETWLLFASAALVVILIPGPLSLLMVSNSLNYGLRRSAPAFIGGVSASLCLLSASALGLGALLLASERLFSLLKIVGALYLFYLAWQSWQESRKAAKPVTAEEQPVNPGFRSMFWKAFGLGASNPKDIQSRKSDASTVAGDDRHLGGARSGLQAVLRPQRPRRGALLAFG